MSKISSKHLERQAVVYVRQSTLTQVQNNLESQRRQYALADRARTLGWQDVITIDDDLGRSGSGSHRPGFERLLASLCEGTVGAVFCIEASRLARNGRDWHTLLEFCRLVGTLLIDEEGIYDPGQPNDRLLLGMKGTLSEMELTTLHQRSWEAILQKAKRGELHATVPVGFLVTTDDRLEMDPDRRVREAIKLVFQKFREFGSVRQVLVWLRQERIELPSAGQGAAGTTVLWRLPNYTSVHHMLTNPKYAGAYAFGRTRTVTRIEKGRKCSLPGKRVPQEEWRVLIPEHHRGYITWDEYQTNQRQIAQNAAMRGLMVRGPVRRGEALLAGLLRCARCGRMLHVAYAGPNHPRYDCRGAAINHGRDKCIAFGGRKADRLLGEELLRRLAPLGVQAALEAIDRQLRCGDEQFNQKELALEQARYEVARARRQYDAVDPDNRLVAGELERRWNEALQVYGALEQELETMRAVRPPGISAAARRELLKLGEDLPALWNHPNSTVQLKKRIVRTLVKEIIVNKTNERISMVVHWQGGDHTTLEYLGNKAGQHRNATPTDVIALIRELARVAPDQAVISILNRLGRRTGTGLTWTEGRLRMLRSNHDIPTYKLGERLARGELTLEETAKTLNVSKESVRRMIGSKLLTAQQACKGAPWIIQRADVERISAGTAVGGPHTKNADQITLEFQ